MKLSTEAHHSRPSLSSLVYLCTGTSLASVAKAKSSNFFVANPNWICFRENQLPIRCRAGQSMSVSSRKPCPCPPAILKSSLRIFRNDLSFLSTAHEQLRNLARSLRRWLWSWRARHSSFAGHVFATRRSAPYKTVKFNAFTSSFFAK